MAEFSYVTRTTVTHEWRIPEGSAVVEFSKAYADAASTYKEVTGLTPDHDDWARVYPTADGVAIRFEVPRG